LDIRRLADENLAIEVEEPIYPGSWGREEEDRPFGETVATTLWKPRQAAAHRLFLNVSSGWLQDRTPEQIPYIAD